MADKDGQMTFDDFILDNKDDNDEEMLEQSEEIEDIIESLETASSKWPTWMVETQNKLDELIERKRLPEKSLYLAVNRGRLHKDKITSYSICIFEPEYPIISYNKTDITRNSIVMKITDQAKGMIRLYVNKSMYFEIGCFDGCEIRENKSDNDNIHIWVDMNNPNISDYIAKCTEYKLKHYSAKASSFGCCSKHVECREKGECQHVNKLYAMACMQRRIMNLD